ncbi:branched-chain amino acid ABC transporter permease [Candidatus Entotheonella palauensis]|uniref:branched-chain amino acid ABC transporter permease n=1 Tax=Candidatus Entotheonella palauensis TaxID=93172 RepID=UPI000B7D7116|nr:branched-chain amino acid ABC transporter permease [Candidatus Entotheonella palauensis]
MAKQAASLQLIEAVERSLQRTRQVHRLMPWVIAFTVLTPLPWLLANTYHVYLANYTCLMILLSVGLNIVKGFCGQVTVGHVGLYAIGAYTSAVLAVNVGVPFWLSLPIAVLVTMLAGVVVGTPSFRLEGAYLALVTLGLGESVRIFISVTEYLGATNGFSGIPAPRIGAFRFDTYQKYYYLVMPTMFLGVYFSFQILRSRLGRAFMAVREDPLAAAAAGVNVRRHKLIAFVISAAYAGFAGALYAHMLPGYLNPRNFTVIEMVTLLLMVVLGGLGHIWGGIIGAIIVTIVYDITKDYYHYSLLLFGSVIVLTVLFMPKGIGGIIDRFIVTRRFIALRAEDPEESESSRRDA